MTSIDAERAKFEKWARDNAPYLDLRHPSHDERGFYWQETETQFKAFQGGWLARAGSERVVSVGELEALCGEWEAEVRLRSYTEARPLLEELRTLIAKAGLE